MLTAKQLANEFTFIDLEPWIEEVETRIANVKYPSNTDLELLPKLKEALEISNNLPAMSEEEIEGLCMDKWAEERAAEFY